MTDVLLTHSYFLYFDPKQAKAQMPYPPLGTLYAAGYLESNNISVKLFDTMLSSSESELRDVLRTIQPKILVIYDDDFNYLNKMCLTRMREAAFVMSAIAKEFNIPVFVHGSDAADHVEKYLSNHADVVIIGEGEQTLLETCNAYLTNQQSRLNTIHGIAFVSNGKIITTEKRNVIRDLDSLPFPAWNLVDVERYRTIWEKHHGYFAVNMVTTRGCPYHCNWCAKPIYGQVYNSRSPEHVVKELMFLQSELQPDHIWFADDIFGLKPGWVQQFSKLVIEHNVKIPFMIQSRADLLAHDDTVEALANAGCVEVWIGAESGSQKILDAMEKGITVWQISEARRLLKKHGIKASFFLQFGYRGELLEDIQATISMVKDLMPDNIGISVSYPLPGTKFYETVKSNMGEKKNWFDSDDLAMMYRGTYSPRYYKLLHRYVHKIFRCKQGVSLFKDFVRFKSAVTKSQLRRIILLVYYIPALFFDRIRLRQLSKV
ncbi:MAG: radical SAM protein [Bacteroidota bacterium]|nr:radical SAM protein [Bacteroidota bacterium]